MWDVTCVDTFAEGYLTTGALQARFAAEATEEREVKIGGYRRGNNWSIGAFNGETDKARWPEDGTRIG